MDRRRFVVLIGSALATPLAGAKRPSRLPVLGILSPHPDGEGREDRLSAMAGELVRERVNAIWAVRPEAAVAAAHATQTIPIVFWGVGCPVEQGLIDSFARPGRNVTGIAFQMGVRPKLKLLEFLKEIAPAVKRVATIFVPSAMTDVSGKPFFGSRPAGDAAVKKLGLDRRI